MLDIKFDGLTGFSEDQKKKVYDAGKLLIEIVNTDLFKKKVTFHSYKEPTSIGHLWWKKTYIVTHKSAFHYTNDNAWRVYERIMRGAEILKPQADSTINVDLSLVIGEKGVLGFTYPNSLRTYIAKWFFDGASAQEVASNIMHEWCHKIGYGHEYLPTSLRQYSVPYAVGYIIRDWKFA